MAGETRYIYDTTNPTKAMLYVVHHSGSFAEELNRRGAFKDRLAWITNFHAVIFSRLNEYTIPQHYGVSTRDTQRDGEKIVEKPFYINAAQQPYWLLI